jgi:hypothetical protein
MNNKQIANAVAVQYNAGKYGLSWEGKAEFKVDGMTLRCNNTPDAVSALVERYKKGVPFNGKTQAWPQGRRTNTAACSITTFLSFWDDGEFDNAREYLRQFPQAKWPTKALAILNDAERA